MLPRQSRPAEQTEYVSKQAALSMCRGKDRCSKNCPKEMPGSSDLLPGLSQLATMLGLDVLEHRVFGLVLPGAQSAAPPAEEIGHAVNISDCTSPAHCAKLHQEENAAAWFPMADTQAAVQPAHNNLTQSRPGRRQMQHTEQSKH